MAAMTRDDYVRLVEQDYFGNVAAKDIPAVLACFTEDATVTIFHGDAAPRVFKAAPGAGEQPLSAFFEHLVANYNPRFVDFEHYVEPEAERCASRFTVKLTPGPDSAYDASGPQELRNCNFFDCRGGRIHAMIIYYTNPGSAGDTHGNRPTGFPQKS